MEIAEVIGAGLAVKLLTALIGAFSIWLLARVFDRISKVSNFHQKVRELEGVPFALYYGFRLFSIALFMGLVFSG